MRRIDWTLADTSHTLLLMFYFPIFPLVKHPDANEKSEELSLQTSSPSISSWVTLSQNNHHTVSVAFCSTTTLLQVSVDFL